MGQFTAPVPAPQVVSPAPSRGLRARVRAASSVGLVVVLGPANSTILTVPKARVLRRLAAWRRRGPVVAEEVFGQLVIGFGA